MFCHQCEQAAKGIGCDVQGVCGKKPEVSDLQDNLLYGLKGLAIFADKARKLGVKDQDIDVFMLEGLFATVTNVDFDPARLEATIRKCFEMKEKARVLFEDAFRKTHSLAVARVFKEGPAAWVPAADLAKQGQQYGILSQHENEDIRSAIEILIYGLKGMAAYADHCQILGKHNDEIYAFFHQALAATADPTLGLMDYVGLSME
jgi:hydroxylamine reductase